MLTNTFPCIKFSPASRRLQQPHNPVLFCTLVLGPMFISTSIFQYTVDIFTITKCDFTFMICLCYTSPSTHSKSIVQFLLTLYLPLSQSVFLLIWLSCIPPSYQLLSRTIRASLPFICLFMRPTLTIWMYNEASNSLSHLLYSST